jgi:hypothetical protein
MFLKLGFKSITMDDIASEMCISKKPSTNISAIKKYSLRSTALIHKVHEIIDNIITQDYNAIEENFEIRKCSKCFSPPHPDLPIKTLLRNIRKVLAKEINNAAPFLEKYRERNSTRDCTENINRKLYQVLLYIVFSVKKTTQSEKEGAKKKKKIRNGSTEYHTNSMASIRNQGA